MCTVNLRMACGHWQKARLSGCPRVAEVYVASLRQQPCAKCLTRQLAPLEPEAIFAEYARSMCRHGEDPPGSFPRPAPARYVAHRS